MEARNLVVYEEYGGNGLPHDYNAVPFCKPKEGVQLRYPQMPESVNVVGSALDPLRSKGQHSIRSPHHGVIQVPLASSCLVGRSER